MASGDLGNMDPMYDTVLESIILPTTVDQRRTSHKKRNSILKESFKKEKDPGRKSEIAPTPRKSDIGGTGGRLSGGTGGFDGDQSTRSKAPMDRMMD